MDDMTINKVWSNNANRSARQASRSKTAAPFKQVGSRGPFCPSCYYLGQQLQTKIHTKHLPSDCPRKALAVNMLKMEDFEHFQDEGKFLNPPVLSNKHLNDVQVLKTRFCFEVKY